MEFCDITAAGLTYEHAYRLLVEHSPVAVWINYENRIVYINAAGLKLLRARDPGQVLGRSPYDFIHPRYHADVSDRIQRVKSGEEEVGVIDELFVRLDGTTFPVT